MSKRRWMIDHQGVAAVAEHVLELEHPVRCIVRRCKHDCCGEYHGWRATPDGGFEHTIRISGYCSIEEAEHALWHELGHAQQLERLYNTVPKAREMGPAWAWAESQRRYVREMRALGISRTALDAGDYDPGTYMLHSEEAEAEARCSIS